VARSLSHTFSTGAVRHSAEARMSEARQDAPLLRTPLYKFHLERGARLVAFAGYEMPVQYPTGILTEHLHARAAAGLFDISHMGQIAMRSMAGRPEDAARALETLVPIDVIGIGEGRQRYALFTNAAGGILDDLMVANRPIAATICCLSSMPPARPPIWRTCVNILNEPARSILCRIVR